MALELKLDFSHKLIGKGIIDHKVRRVDNTTSEEVFTLTIYLPVIKNTYILPNALFEHNRSTYVCDKALNYYWGKRNYEYRCQSTEFTGRNYSDVKDICMRYVKFIERKIKNNVTSYYLAHQ